MQQVKFFIIIFSLISHIGYSQSSKTKLIDAVSKEPVYGATIQCIDVNCALACTSDPSGEFELHSKECKSFRVTCTGYASQTIEMKLLTGMIYLTPTSSLLNEVVITASRGEGVKRSHAPVAISTLNAKTIQDNKATSADQLLNKVSGVNMVNLGNEQHQMSIRQPMTTKSLFLYLEDGIPIRTTGLFNHNALLEMNMASVRNIEVIKGPSSSLYGSEAIGGVVNFITIAPTAIPTLKISAQGNNIGYKKLELQSGITSNKWGFALSGYYADKRNSFMEYSDFHKATVTARADYRFSNNTSLSNSLTLMNYYSDMPSGVDSTMFATRKFSNPQTFTYRKVDALRYHSTLTHSWNQNSKSTASIIYRDNTIEQNPSYRIKDDYKKTGNTYTGKKDLAHGEINNNSFKSFGLIAQHKEKFQWKDAVLMGGVNLDLSPSSYRAEYIRIKKDTVTKKYTAFQKTDSTLTNYETNIKNYAAFLNFELTPIPKLRVVASLRYDLFHYDFNNHLKPSAFSGSPDMKNEFSKISPKIGFTYNLSNKTGIYANYSEGFVPPQVTEMYTGVKVPDLKPAVFYNYEAGGWIELIKNKLSADLSAYKLIGTNEVISVRLDNGSSENRNAGKTMHKGIEMGMNASPVPSVNFRFSAAYSLHEFTEFVEKGNNYNGNEMNGAPHWMHNAEIWYKPAFAKGVRIGAEWQKIGKYFMDPKNTATYEGYDVLNIRAGYQVNGFEIWLNVMNATDAYYSNNSTKSTSYSYQLGEPRNFNIGIAYDFGKLFKGKR